MPRAGRAQSPHDQEKGFCSIGPVGLDRVRRRPRQRLGTALLSRPGASCSDGVHQEGAKVLTSTVRVRLLLAQEAKASVTSAVEWLQANNRKLKNALASEQERVKELEQERDNRDRRIAELVRPLPRCAAPRSVVTGGSQRQRETTHPQPGTLLTHTALARHRPLSQEGRLVDGGGGALSRGVSPSPSQGQNAQGLSSLDESALDSMAPQDGERPGLRSGTQQDAWAEIQTLRAQQNKARRRPPPQLSRLLPFHRTAPSSTAQRQAADPRRLRSVSPITERSGRSCAGAPGHWAQRRRSEAPDGAQAPGLVRPAWHLQRPLTEQSAAAALPFCYRVLSQLIGGR